MGLVGGRATDDPYVVELYWALLPAYWGQGLIDRAAAGLVRHLFEHVGVERVWAQVGTDNPRSTRVCERLGLAREGLLKRALWRQGESPRAAATRRQRDLWADGR